MAAGWTAFPSVILERQDGLGLDPVDVNIILHLAMYWWWADNPPHPSKRRIARCIGRDASTVRKRIQRLEELGFLTRVPRYGKDGQQLSNIYRFDGLIKEATPYAEEELKERALKKKETTERKTRKRPKLVVVEGGKKKGDS